MFKNALTMFSHHLKMDLQRISVPLKNIANVSKRNGNALQRIFNALKMHYNKKNASTLFSLSLLFPNRVTNMSPSTFDPIKLIKLLIM